MNYPPIFVIGSPRSGTTLLRLMLTGHPRIVVPPEGGFAVWLYKQYSSKKGRPIEDRILKRFARDVIQCRKMHTWNMDQEGLLSYLQREKPETYSDMVSGVYSYFLSRTKPNAVRWGDKNNTYLDSIPTILEMFPNALFLHIVRDGRDVVCSCREIMSKHLRSEYAPNFPNKLSALAKTWVDNVHRIRRSFDLIGWRNVYELKYEQLVTLPEIALTKLCLYIKEEFSPEMLNYQAISLPELREPLEFIPWKEKTTMPVSTQSIKRFKLDLSRNEISEIQVLMMETLVRYGYE